VVEPIRIRARVEGGLTEVKVLMPHPMETGLRGDGHGALRPAHHIALVRVSHRDRVVLVAHLSIAVSQDPLLAFRFKGAQPGERLCVEWIDSRGLSRRDDAVIT